MTTPLLPTQGATLPTVSVCTPTFNRRPYLPTLFACFRNQTYPAANIEWVIVDDGTDCVEDLVRAANIPQIKYYRVARKMTLGAKRNYMHSKAIGDIIVYMDDDDYYPPTRIEHAVQRLSPPDAIFAGTNVIHVHFPDLVEGDDRKTSLSAPGKIVAFCRDSAFGPNHATAGTFAFKRQLLETCAYDPEAAYAEEAVFLKDFTIPMVRLDPVHTILVFAHGQNTFDKRQLIPVVTPHETHEESGAGQESMCTTLAVHDFIRGMNELPIAHFFLEDILRLETTYPQGHVSYKPDVVAQQHRQQELQEQAMADLPVVLTDASGATRVLKPAELYVIIQNVKKAHDALVEELVEAHALIQSLHDTINASSCWVNRRQK